MEHGEGTGGIVQIFKNAIPLISRVGVLAGGIVTLLSVLGRVSGTIVTALEGFLLLATVITSGMVAFGRTQKVIEGKTKIIPLYPPRQRRIAMIFFILAGVFASYFFIRIGPEMLARLSGTAETIGTPTAIASPHIIVVAVTAPIPTATQTLSLDAQRTLAVEKAAQATVLARASWPVVLSDNFSRVANGWGTGAFAGDITKLTREISGGKYRWNVSVNALGGARTMPAMKEVSDFDFSVSARLVSGPNTAEYGVVFRFTDDNNYYRFGIRNDRTWQFQTKAQGTYLPPITRDQINAIRPGELNRISVSAQGAHFIFLVNDQYVGAVTDDRIKSGKVALNVNLYNPGDEMQIEWENFELRAP